MVILNEASVAVKRKKPLLCPKCAKGRIGSVPEGCKTNISRRGLPPPDKPDDGVYVRCPICGAHTLLTIE